jgi:hypothetical protein
VRRSLELRPVANVADPLIAGSTVGGMNERLAFRRALVWLELLVAGSGIGIVAVAALLAPWFSRGMFPSEALSLWDLAQPAALVGALIGYAWMIRIAFRDPEAGPSPWRYRAD